MGLDIRLPIGLMFSLIGALLVITGLVNGADARSLNININLWWGSRFARFWRINAARRNAEPEDPAAGLTSPKYSLPATFLYVILLTMLYQL